MKLDEAPPQGLPEVRAGYTGLYLLFNDQRAYRNQRREPIDL